MGEKIKLYSRKQIRKMDLEQLKEYERNLLNVKYPTERMNDDLLEIEISLNNINK